MNPRTRDVGVTALKGCGCLLLVLVVVAILFPIFASTGRHPHYSSCMANMNQIAKAILSYTGEYDDKFPCTRVPGTANGMRPEQCIEPRRGAIPFGGATWVQRIDPYVAKGSIEDAHKGVMIGVFNCPEREKKWCKGVTPDWHSYGYNFLYLGLPWSKTNAPKANPYRAWGFVAGIPTVSRLENTAGTILLVESRSIWAYPPYYNTPLAAAQVKTAIRENKLCISPRHSYKANVAFCDGHTKAMDGTELVGKIGQNGLLLKNGERGVATSNRLWDVVKTKAGMGMYP